MYHRIAIVWVSPSTVWEAQSVVVCMEAAKAFLTEACAMSCLLGQAGAVALSTWDDADGDAAADPIIVSWVRLMAVTVGTRKHLRFRACAAQRPRWDTV
jgi:hypothetical protein